MQKAIIVSVRLERHDKWVESGMDEVNQLLSEGWKVISATPMGGAASSTYSTDLKGSKMAFTSMMVLESDN